MSEYESLLEESIEVAAPPAQVWSLVTDLPRMSQWSPQVVRTIVRGPVQLGTKAFNINRRGPLFWPTRTKVVEFEPHREFAFRVKDNYTVWSFTLEPTATGTRVIQRRRAPEGISDISIKLTRIALGGQQNFTRELREGMRQTLSRVKAESEA
ncbi:SRPBCC family protein [Nocardioides sp.]|uniref:SRPBCC family protein n=1 Tax=Nocardioides sp. TaxID=35761 RepID=UPI002D7EA148|nr:SRPBCC family protein [Nocardioides sp.]HET8961892.1 SRPBCC family protein [Nocardioides sp.]